MNNPDPVPPASSPNSQQMELSTIERELLHPSYSFETSLSTSDSNEEYTFNPSPPTTPSVPPVASLFFSSPPPKPFPLTPSLALHNPQSPPPMESKRTRGRTRRANKDLSQSDDDEERREKVKNSEKKRRDRLSYWFGEIQKLLFPPPTDTTSEQDKITYARKKRELRKEDILEMTTIHIQESKLKQKLINRIVAKLALDNHLNFASFTQEDVSTAFDSIYGQLPNDRDSPAFRTLLNTLYTLAKKSAVPQHEIVVLETASSAGVSLTKIPSTNNSPRTPTISPQLTPRHIQAPNVITPFLSERPPAPLHSPSSIMPPSPSLLAQANSYLTGAPAEWGKYFYPDGSVYEGEWQNGKAHGRGTLLYSTGDRYAGEWVATQKHGQGEFTYANGDIYKGEWKNDRANGYGVLLYASGAQYAGNWIDDKRHGYGIFESQGQRYEGEWVHGRKEGKGVLHFPSGDMYAGFWKNGVTVSGVYTFRSDSLWCNPDF